MDWKLQTAKAFRAQGWWTLVRGECPVEMVDRITVPAWIDDWVNDYVEYTKVGKNWTSDKDIRHFESWDSK